MKRLLVINLLSLVFFFSLSAQFENMGYGKKIVIETSLGNIELLLYDDTPLHRDNMIKLIKEGYFDGQLFHRVINNFMVQGGDPNSVNAVTGQRLGTGGPGYQIPAEFNANRYHKKGALAAARQGDGSNPEKKSSGSQFYIVKGQVFTVDQLVSMQSRGNRMPFTKEQIEVYSTLGGTPHLDGAYTVFGEVTGGMDVLDAISAVPTDDFDRPIENIVYTIKLK